MDSLLDTAPCGFLSFADDGTILAVNTTLREWLGYESGILYGRSVETLLPVASRIFYQTHFFPLLKISGAVEEVYMELRTATGEELPMLVNAARREHEETLVNDCVFMVVRQRNRYEDEILQARRTIESLNQHLQRAMTETHHRVKNNLQIIAALIDLQQGAEREMVPMSEFRRLGQSISALGMIHDILTKESQASGEVGHTELISVKEVLSTLLPMLERSIGARHLHYRLDEARLPGKHVTALSLITNELVSNAIKHGKGDVEVHFRVDEQTATMEVRDDGPGFTEHFDPMQASNTGLELIENIARWDLQGTTSYATHTEGGGWVTISFPLPTS